MLNLITDVVSNHHFNRYRKLISYCQSQSFEGYTENHHILPKSMFPQFVKDPNNIVTVTPRIHFILHYLLWKSLRNRQTWYAFKCMRARTKNHGLRYHNSRLFSTLRGQMKMSDEHKQAISNSLKGRTFSDETKIKMSAHQKGKPKPSSRRPKSKEARIKLSKALKGTTKCAHYGSDNHMSKSVIIGSHSFATITKCCEITGLSYHNVSNFVNNGKIPSRGEGRKILLSLIES